MINEFINDINKFKMNKEFVEQVTWFAACQVTDVPQNGGVCVKYRDEQIALFHFSRRGEWYATQNLCPHKQQMSLSRGMIGTQGTEPKIACPFHKKSFSLVDGHCMNDEENYRIKTYPVKVEGNMVFVGFHTEEEVSRICK
jgi:nitrite reductase (NADH) small subunit